MPAGPERDAALDQFDMLSGRSKWIEGRPTHVYGEMGQIIGENANILNTRTGLPLKVSSQPDKPAVPAGVAVGAKTKQPDGSYSLPNGRKVTVSNGVITELQ